ncbi:MAG: M42 family metallopeptidase [Clostridia bacterium]
MNTQDLLKSLSSAVGVSGHEYIYSSQIKKAFEDYCDSVSQDSMGNVIGVIKSKKENPYKLMLAAHMDEIGLMVKEIDEKGFIHFTNIGGVDHRILLSQEVVVHGKEDLFGVIGAKPPHLQALEETKKAVKMEDMAIDVGLSAEKLREIVNIGDTITFHAAPIALLNNYFCGKSLDDRAGIIVIIECLKELQTMKTDVEIYAVATVQEEVGTRGAVVSSYHINADIGIAIDVCHGETPDAAKDETFPTGKGPVITIGSNIHPKLSKKLMDTAKEYNIPYQIDVEPGNTGTDAWAIQVTRSGIPTLLLSFPLRYMHTTVETINFNDIINTGKLLAFFIKKLEGELEELLCY